MSSVITGIIQPQAFELIRDRICQILVVEFENQFQLTGNYDLQNISSSIYMERMAPFDYTELPALNVGIERGDYEQYHQGQSDGVYRYFIECCAISQTDNSKRGDEKAKVLVHKIMGITRAILENPLYKTLGFSPGMIKHRHIESFVFAEPTRMDSENVNQSRLALVVKAIETSITYKDVQTIEEWSSRVKLSDTEKGYVWEPF